MKAGATPPASRYPRVADGTLVPAHRMKWPSVSVLPAVPRGPNPMVQFDYGSKVAQGIIDKVPPQPKPRRYIVLVPAVDADGNETGGVRLPEQAVPAQTSTGWSLRSQAEGGQGELCYLDGQTIPFAPGKMVERYGDRQAYLAKVRESAQALAKDGYVLEEDIDRIVARADRNAKFENSAQ